MNGTIIVLIKFILKYVFTHLIIVFFNLSVHISTISTYKTLIPLMLYVLLSMLGIKKKKNDNTCLIRLGLLRNGIKHFLALIRSSRFII